MTEPQERWEPMPVPQGDGRHDIGDDTRAAICRRLISDWSHDPDLTAEKVRRLAMWAAASVRALLCEIGALKDIAGGHEDYTVDEALQVAEGPGSLRDLVASFHDRGLRLVEAEAALATSRPVSPPTNDVLARSAEAVADPPPQHAATDTKG